MHYTLTPRDRSIDNWHGVSLMHGALAMRKGMSPPKSQADTVCCTPLPSISAHETEECVFRYDGRLAKVVSGIQNTIQAFTQCREWFVKYACLTDTTPLTCIPRSDPSHPSTRTSSARLMSRHSFPYRDLIGTTRTRRPDRPIATDATERQTPHLDLTSPKQDSHTPIGPHSSPSPVPRLRLRRPVSTDSASPCPRPSHSIPRKPSWP